MDFYSFFIVLLLPNIGITNADLNNRLDCYIENNFKIEQKSCEERGCIWDSKNEPQGIPICYLDTKNVGYKALNTIKKSTNGIEAELVLKETSKKLTKFPQIENLKLEVHYLTDRILRFKIFDPKHNRYEVPVQKDFPLLQKNPKESDETKRKYSVELSFEESKDNFHFSISRKDNKNKVFDTSIGGLVFSDQFIQIATNLPSKNIYGLGENVHKTLRHNLNYKTWPMFALDTAVGDHDKNLYGVHPFYTCLENDGKSHGVLLLNSNAMEYTLLPQPAISLKTLGGILDFFVFIGDNPEQVVSLYTSLIGRPVMPPFWGLGFQLTRYGFRDTNNVKETIDRNIAAKIPLDVMYVDIDYMNRYQDFTYDKTNFAKLPELVTNTKRDNKLRWTLIIDPAIEGSDAQYGVFTDGYKQDLFVKWPKNVSISERHNPTNVPNDKDVMWGKVWPNGPAAFPDFFKNRTHAWWTKWAKSLHDEVKYDALWIDMNEPSNFQSNCPRTKYDFPEVRTSAVYRSTGNGQLSHNTACMTALQGENNEYQHYDVHSLYGWSETKTTRQTLQEVTGKRGFVVSRSTYVSSGRYGSHWLGDNFSAWDNIRFSIIGMLEFNLFGIGFVGADICGFLGETTPELCRRWLALGAFYPFSRSHNVKGASDQDPAVWIKKGHTEVTDTARNALLERYTMLPYLYTLFYRAHVLGETVARPVFHEFPHDNNTHGIDQQFMWGRSVLISPFLFQNQKEVDAYLPDDVWYKLSPTFVRESKTGHIKIPDTPNSAPPIHLRGGSIIPLSDSFVHSDDVRKDPLDLIVIPGKSKTASGDLFGDDGESIDTVEAGKYNYYKFELHSNCTLVIDVIHSGYSSGTNPQSIEHIVVKGTVDEAVEAHIDGKVIPNPTHNNMGIKLLVNINLESKKADNKWVITWVSTKTKTCNIQ